MKGIVTTLVLQLRFVLCYKITHCLAGSLVGVSGLKPYISPNLMTIRSPETENCL